MKNNKLVCVLLTLLVCLSMVVSAAATTESDFVFALESADSSVEALDAAVVGAGETFTVTVNVEANPGALFAIAHVKFDSTKLELVSSESLAEGVVVPASNAAGRVSVILGDMNAMFAPKDFEAVTVTGAVAKLTFKVLEEADVQTSITLEAKSGNVMNANGKYDSTVSGDVLNVNVVSAEHVCDENKTVEANNAVEATCTEAGKASDIICAHCGKLVSEGEAIAALGHTKGETKVENTVDATCTTDGSYDNVVYCSVCGEEVSRETVTVAATGHAWGEWSITTAPSCASFGVQSRTCSSCGETEVDDHVPATGEHTFGEWTEKTPATTEAEGVETRKCSGCGTEETRAIAKLPVEPAPKSNALVIVIIVVVVLAGAGVAAYFVLKNKKK